MQVNSADDDDWGGGGIHYFYLLALQPTIHSDLHIYILNCRAHPELPSEEEPPHHLLAPPPQMDLICVKAEAELL